MTALAVMSLVEDGTLSLGTTARSLLGTDLPLIADDVTVEHLLAHTSGIGDYLDEDDDIPISAYAMTVPVHAAGHHRGSSSRVLDGFPTAFPAGQTVLLLQRRVRGARPAGGACVRGAVPRPRPPARLRARPAWSDTDFLRSDALPGRAALGYVEMDGAVADQRVPPAGARHRRRRDLHDRRGRAPVLDRAVRRRDRQPGQRGPDGAAAQHGAVRRPAVRAGVLGAPDPRRRPARGVRRRARRS